MTLVVRIKYIDVLKALAIIAVVLYHTGLMTFGYLGVDLFLVINGYLITKILSNQVLKTNELRSGYLAFQSSRIIRLLPPLLVVGAVCMALGYFVMLPDDYENLSQSVIATNIFGNNILSAITTKNYWDVANEYKPLMHTWYVGVLMQFYIVYPILFYFARLNKENPKRTLLTIISTLAVVSLLVYFSIGNAAHRFYYLPSRFFEFAVGGIAALLYNPKESKPFGKAYIYLCYILLLALLFVDGEFIPSAVRLVAVVGLSCVIVCSQDVLENKITGNVILAKIGAASYSIFIWHQVLLAFYRYTVTSKFTIGSYAILLAATAVLSWLSYHFIEQKAADALRTKRGKALLYSLVSIAFLALTGFAGYIFMRAGVVRDVPELSISKDNIHRGMHAEYVDRVYQYDKPFTTDKPHWFIVGDSFGRDFVNIILESPVADSVEISYSQNYGKEFERFRMADKVFLASQSLTERLVTEIELLCMSQGQTPENIVIVGIKNFGTSNGQVYTKRHQPDYFEQYTEVADAKRYIDDNKHFAQLYGDRYLDLMSHVVNDKNEVRVFTPNHHYMSADCRHLSKGGAVFYGREIEWKRFL